MPLIESIGELSFRVTTPLKCEKEPVIFEEKHLGDTSLNFSEYVFRFNDNGEIARRCCHFFLTSKKPYS
jgi:hypothetical protein